MDVTRSHRPDKNVRKRRRQIYDSDISSDENIQIQPNSRNAPKVKQMRCRSVTTKCFKKILAASENNNGRTKIMSMNTDSNEIKVAVYCREVYRVTISRDLKCSCKAYQRATRKTTCWHIVWVLVNLFNVEKDSKMLAQVEVGDEVLKKLLSTVPSVIPEALKTVSSNHHRLYHPQLVADRRFGNQQKWLLRRKLRGRSARCAGCLTQNAIHVGDLHFSVEGGLLYKPDNNTVVQTTHSFCLKRQCVTSIKGYYNNIIPLKDSTRIEISPDLSDITDLEKSHIADQDIQVVGLSAGN